MSSGDLELSLESFFWSLEGEKVTFLLSEMAWEPGGRSGLSAVLSIFDVRGRMRGAAEFSALAWHRWIARIAGSGGLE